MVGRHVLQLFCNHGNHYGQNNYCIAGNFLLVQIFTEVRLYSPEEIFAVFVFVEQKHNALTTPLSDDGYTPYACVPKKWHWTTKRSKFVQQWPTLPFAITKVSRLHAGSGENWLVEQKDSALLIWNSTTSECFLRVRWYFVHMVAGWVCFATTYYREDIIFAADEL